MLLSSFRNSANRQLTSGWTFRNSEVQSSQILVKSSWIISLLRFVTHLGISSILNGKYYVSLVSCWWIPIFPNRFIHCWLVLSQYLYPQSHWLNIPKASGILITRGPHDGRTLELRAAHVIQTLDLNLQCLLRVVTKDERNNVPRLNMDPEWERRSRDLTPNRKWWFHWQRKT